MSVLAFISASPAHPCTADASAASHDAGDTAGGGNTTGNATTGNATTTAGNTTADDTGNGTGNTTADDTADGSGGNVTGNATGEGGEDAEGDEGVRPRDMAAMVLSVFLLGVFYLLISASLIKEHRDLRRLRRKKGLTR